MLKVLLFLLTTIVFAQDDVILNKKDDDIIIDKTNIIEEKETTPSVKVNIWSSTVQKYNRNYEDIEKLILNGQNINQDVVDSYNMILLASSQNDNKLFNLSVNYNADINSVNKNGQNILYFFAKNENIDGIKYLIEKNIFTKLNKVDKTNRNSLHSFMLGKSSNLDVLKLLLNNKVNVNQQDINGQTPIMYAIVDRKWDVVKLLLSNSDNNLKDNWGQNLNYYLKNYQDLKSKEILGLSFD
jgi:ankyrin repeat protein